MKDVDSRRPRILLNMAVDVLKNREVEVLNSEYSDSVYACGAIPLLCPSIEKEELIESMLDLADGVILIGGKDYDPKNYGEKPHPETVMTRKRPDFDFVFVRAALRRNLPILGICAGCQLLNIVTGGKLIQHLPNAGEHRFTTHEATVTAHGFFSRALCVEPGTRITVNSFHHQAVDPEHLGSGVRITGTAFDGTVEAIEFSGERMVLGVQFHPERLKETGHGFFSLLVEEACALRQKTGKPEEDPVPCRLRAQSNHG